MVASDKTKIDSLKELIQLLEMKNVKFYRLHSKKYFFIDAAHIQKKSINELESNIKMQELYYELLN